MTDLCNKAIAKDINNLYIAFEKLDNGITAEMRKGKIKTGYDNVNVHMIFDIKMDGKFNRKARLVADGHTTAPPSSITHSSIVSRESVKIKFLLAPFNDLDIFSCDIGNA